MPWKIFCFSGDYGDRCLRHFRCRSGHPKANGYFRRIHSGAHHRRGRRNHPGSDCGEQSAPHLSGSGVSGGIHHHFHHRVPAGHPDVDFSGNSVLRSADAAVRLHRSGYFYRERHSNCLPIHQYPRHHPAGLRGRYYRMRRRRTAGYDGRRPAVHLRQAFLRQRLSAGSIDMHPSLEPNRLRRSHAAGRHIDCGSPAAGRPKSPGAFRKQTFRKNRFLASDRLRHHGADPHQRETDNHTDHGLPQMFQVRNT